MPAMVLAAPLLGAFVRRRAAVVLVGVLTIAALPAVLLHENYKPLLSRPGAPSILKRDRLAQQSLDDSTSEAAVRRLGTLVGAREPLGFIVQPDLTEYYLFGEPLERRLVRFTSGEVSAQALRAKHVRFLFIGFASAAPCKGASCTPHTPGLRITRLADDAYLASLR